MSPATLQERAYPKRARQKPPPSPKRPRGEHPWPRRKAVGTMQAWPHPTLASLREQFPFTYGFSFLYRRALFPTFSFLATSWGEDQDILRRVREAGRKVVLYGDRQGLCLHNQHGENCSRSSVRMQAPSSG